MEVKVINKSVNDLPKYQTSLSAGCDVNASFNNGVNEKFLFDSEFLNEVAPIDQTVISEGHEDFISDIGRPACVVIKPMGRALIPTGLYVEIPEGYEIQVRPRSGNALKYGVTVLNTPGTIDSDYRGEIGVILMNLSNENFIVFDGDRIAQLVLNKFEQIEWKQENSLNETERSNGGFGSTGK